MLQAAGGVAWCLDPCSRYRGGVTPERTCCRVSQGREQVVLDGEASSAFRALTPLFVSLSLCPARRSQPSSLDASRRAAVPARDGGVCLRQLRAGGRDPRDSSYPKEATWSGCAARPSARAPFVSFLSSSRPGALH